MPPRQNRGAIWLRIGQVICTFALAFILWRSIEWSLFLATLSTIDWAYLGLAAIFLLIAHCFNIVRWRGLLPEAIPLSRLAIYYGAGQFSNNFLPTGVGGDAIRTALVSPQVGWPAAFLSVGLDRLIGLLGLGFFILPGLWLGLPSTMLQQLAIADTMGRWLWPLILLGAMVAIGLGGLIAFRFKPLPQKLIERLRSGGKPNAEREKTWLAWLSTLSRGYGLSVCSNLSLIAAHWAILQALGVNISPGASIWLAVVGSLSLLIPLSINGLGVLESVFVIILGAYEIPAATALAAALLLRGLGMLYSLAGGALSLRLRASKAIQPTKLIG